MARLLRDQGYTATTRAQLLAESGVSNGSLYHHFPGGMEELAEAALEASGAVVADALREALNAAPNAGEGVVRFLDIAWGAATGTVRRLPDRADRTRITHHQPPSTRRRGAVLRRTGSPDRRAASRRRMARRLRLGGGIGGARPHRGRTAARSRERATEPPRSRQARCARPTRRATRGGRHSNPNVLTRGESLRHLRRSTRSATSIPRRTDCPICCAHAAHITQRRRTHRYAVHALMVQSSP